MFVDMVQNNREFQMHGNNKVKPMPKGGLKITCIERKYKVTGSRVSYIITAKKELDEDVTEKLLHEDMELKTFLANYDISSIILPVVSVVSEGSKKEITEVKIKRATVKTNAVARRELFDFLDLPEEFTTSDYEDALKKKKIKVTNPVMANDDFSYFLELGKIERTGHKIKCGRNWSFGYRRKSEVKDYDEDNNKVIENLSIS